MKAVILAGGIGSRLMEETVARPKPMVEIGGKPILWHIMKTYAHYGINDFVICLGYRGYLIKEYFANYALHLSDVTIDLSDNSLTVHQRQVEPWRVTLVHTGDNTQTGGRLKRIQSYVEGADFCMTYGDGVGDIDIARLVEFHRQHGKAATITATQPPGRFGVVDIDGHNRVLQLREKPLGDGGWINGGFFVLSPTVFDLIGGDETAWEGGPLQRLAADGDLVAYRHPGFWQPMDTLRERNYLEELWATGKAPWRVW